MNLDKSWMDKIGNMVLPDNCFSVVHLKTNYPVGKLSLDEGLWISYSGGGTWIYLDGFDLTKLVLRKRLIGPRLTVYLEG